MIRFWGTTIEETMDAFRGIHLGDKSNEEESREKTKAVIRIVLTFLLLIIGVYMIVADTEKDVGGTILGAICGYWLK